MLLLRTAMSFQSCQTLCDSIDGSPPGSPIPGILQARTLEWVAISFSNAWKWKVKVKSLSRVQLLVTTWTQPTRLLRPWDFPGKSTVVGCHCLLRSCFEKYHPFSLRRRILVLLLFSKMETVPCSLTSGALIIDLTTEKNWEIEEFICVTTCWIFSSDLRLYKVLKLQGSTLILVLLPQLSCSIMENNE